MQYEGDVDSSRRIKVLHVIGSLNRGGIETWLVDGMRYRDTVHFEWAICTYRFPDGLRQSEVREENIPVKHIQLRNTFFGVVAFVFSLYRLLRTEVFDVVHCHGGTMVGLVMLMSRLAKVRVRIAHSHNSSVRRVWRNNKIQRWSEWIGARLARTMANSGIGCSELAGKYLFGSDWRKGKWNRILYCGIELASFSEPERSSSHRSDLGIPNHAKVIGHVGSFSAGKNQEFLVDLIADVREHVADVVLCLVGDGAGRGAIEAKIHASNLQDRVIFTGSTDDVARKMIDVFDVFALPSVHEGLPLVLLEAQAAGLNCVISDQVTGEAVLDWSTVRAISLQDRKGWIDALVSALARPRPMRPGYAQMVGGNFDIRTSIASLEAIYSELCRNATRR